MNVCKIILAICVVVALEYACTQSMAGVQLPKENEFFNSISEYGIYNGQEASQHLIPYTVTNQLFTDNAVKDRFIYLPEGKKAILKPDGFFEWPEGAIMVKNFRYTEEQIGEARIIETRLLIKDKNAWKAMSYKWNEDKKDAAISKVGDVIPLNVKGQEFDYIIPNKNQCKGCHNYNEEISPLGFKYSNLGEEQLRKFQQNGIVDLGSYADSLRHMIAYTDKAQDIQDRALAYLDVNCGHCHRPEGPGNTSGLFLQYDETRSNHLGWCKGPVAAGRGSGGRKYDIYPGHPESSILYYRMASIDPGEMMPEVGRSTKDEAGLAIVEEWIKSINFNCNE